MGNFLLGVDENSFLSSPMNIVQSVMALPEVTSELMSEGYEPANGEIVYGNGQEMGLLGYTGDLAILVVAPMTLFVANRGDVEHGLGIETEKVIFADQLSGKTLEGMGVDIQKKKKSKRRKRKRKTMTFARSEDVETAKRSRKKKKRFIVFAPALNSVLGTVFPKGGMLGATPSLVSGERYNTGIRKFGQTKATAKEVEQEDVFDDVSMFGVVAKPS